MVDRQNETREALANVEREIQSLRATLISENRLSSRVKHDFANAMTLVLAFRELLKEPADEEILADATEAVHRAHALASACMH